MKKSEAQSENTPVLCIKRAYATPGPEDGYRVLVDRLWPRGIGKSELQVDDWWKECAPSTELRKWFNHRPSRWDQFRQQYIEELDAICGDVSRLHLRCNQRRITLIYAARDEQHNHAIVLRDFIEARILR